MKARLLSLCLSLLTTQALAGALPLPSLGLDKNSVTVSGISSGAFMAVQLGVAYSDQIHGVASIAGGIYSCALGKTQTATDLCMKAPDKIDVSAYTKLVLESFQKGLIADPKYLAQQRVFILNGSEDKTVMPAAGLKLAEFYQAFGVNPIADFKLKMGHAFPSNNGKNSCEKTQFPWINKCEYEGAQKIFETMYGPLSPPTSSRGFTALSGELKAFDQNAFGAQAAKMLDYGNLYIPKDCKTPGSACRLHIALHGCMQSPNIIQDQFTNGADYNAWADNNKIVVLYPATTMGAGNSSGCWDWFGFTNADYAVRKSVQMTAIMKMVATLTAAP